MARAYGSSYDACEVTATAAKHSPDDDGIRFIDTRGPRKRARVAAACAVVTALGAIAWIAWLGAARVEPPVASASRADVELAPSGAPRDPAPLPVAAKPIGTPVARETPPPAPTQEDEERALERELAQQPTYTIAPPGSPKSGMALFPAPGSVPLLRGIVVPDDFPLPEGYVRHHQVTDEGEALPPILMFHPDFEFVDQSGAPLELPADRVVPPELAPEGMPIEMLAPPAGDGGAGPSS